MPILDNFEPQFMNEASSTAPGLMSSSDKLKLNGLLLDDINYIKNGIQNIKDYTVPRIIYGIKIDPNNPDSDTCVEYTDDAIGFVPLKVDQDTGICNYGSWEDIITNIFGIKPYLVKNNGTIISELNPNNYNKTIDGNTIDIESGDLGQVMIRFKRIYYKFTVDDNKIWFRISNKQSDSSWIDSAFRAEDGIGSKKEEMYIGAYESVLKNNMLQSISNNLPSFKSDYKHVEESSGFGVFHMMNIVRKQFVTFLGYLVTKSINLIDNIGSGNNKGDLLKTGTMNDKGLFYGSSNGTDGVKLFGIENLWGNQLKYMNGLFQKLVYVLNKETGLSDPKQHIYIKEFYPYNRNDDFNDVGNIEPELSGYISTIKFLSYCIYLPENLDGASNTYFKSYFINGKSENANTKLYPLYGGSNTYGSRVGPEFLLLADLKENTSEVTTHIIY